MFSGTLLVNAILTPIQTDVLKQLSEMVLLYAPLYPRSGSEYEESRVHMTSPTWIVQSF